MSGFSYAICSPRSMKFSVAFSTAATSAEARFDLPKIQKQLHENKIICIISFHQKKMLKEGEK
jgi:hypothetical protein